jgi:plastocyanin
MVSLRLLVVSLIMMGAIACGSGYSSPSSPVSPSPAPTPSPTPATTPTPTPTPAGASAVIIPVGAAALGTRAYSPDALNASAGDTVTWMNTDSIAHTSTSDASGWNSGIVAPGGQFSMTFPAAGTFSYHCAIHPGMVGTVVVR